MKDIFIDMLGKPMGIVMFQLLDATQFTIYLSLIAFVGGGIIGAVITLMRISGKPALIRLATSYIWCFQSVPLLMLLFLSGLGVPRLLGQDVNPWVSATISLTLYASAYLAEVWRGAIQAVPKGQWEGGYSVGMRFFPVLRAIILPQALRLALAPIDITYTNSSGRRLGLFRRNDGFEVDLGLMGDGCPSVPPSNGSVPLGY